jgi:Homeodomain-like domain
MARNHLEAVRKAAEALRMRETAAFEAREKLHAKIVEAGDAGESKSAIARAAGVSRQWIARLLETN